MKRYLYALVALAVTLAAASCSKSSDDSGSLTDDCYISSFVLGQMTRAVHATTSDGTDTTYYVSFSGSAFTMLIDQRAQTITPATPLPEGAQTSRLLTTVSFTGALVHAPAADTTSWVAYDSKDSVDLSAPHIYRVISADGTARRDYVVSLSVRTTDPDAYTWTRTDAPMPAASDGSPGTWEVPAEVVAGAELLDTLAYTQTNGNRRVLIACREAGAAATEPLTLWSLLEDWGEWMRLDLSRDNAYGLVAPTRPHLVWYDGALLAFVEGGADILVSRDNGITWKTDYRLTYPDGLALSAADGTPLAMEAVASGAEVWLQVGDARWTLRRNGYTP